MPTYAALFSFAAVNRATSPYLCREQEIRRMEKGMGGIQDPGVEGKASLNWVKDQ